MNFDQYQKESRKTAIYKDLGKSFIYPLLGLVGETGEVAEKVKKIIRDGDGSISKEEREELKWELGDVLWYLSQISVELGFDLDDIATSNIKKLKSRKVRGKLRGSGDRR